MKIFGLIVLFLVLLLIVVFVVMRSRNKSTDNVGNQVIDITPAKPEEIPASEPLVNGQNDSNTGNESDATTESKHYAADCESNCTAPIERKKVDTGELAHILVAEDNLSNYKLVEVMLRNIAVTENAINGKVAVQRVREVEYDMVFMDVKMPVMNGLEATREIRKFDTKIPIIAVTARAMFGDKERILEAKLDDYIAKPYNLNTVVETLNRYIDKKED